MFAARTQWDLTPNNLTALIEARRLAGIPILDLTESNPTRCGLRYPSAAILGALSRSEGLSYDPNPRGDPGARAVIAEILAARGARVPPEHLILTAGTSEAYSFLFRLLADPGDLILAPAPSYPLFGFLAQLNDVELGTYPLSPGPRFGIDLEALSRCAQRGPRALILVNPGNPTGTFLKRGELEALIAICTLRGITIISDEVFGDYGFDDDAERVATLAAERRVLTFTLNGLSKMLGLPQLKLAWIAASGPEPQVAEALRRLEVIADTYLSVNTPVQTALLDLMACRAEIQRMIRERLAVNRDWLASRTAASLACRAVRSEGGWSAILDVPRARSDEQWALSLLREEGLLVHPGYFFEFPDEGHLVVSLLTPEDRFQEGIIRIMRHVDSSA